MLKLKKLQQQNQQPPPTENKPAESGGGDASAPSSEGKPEGGEQQGGFVLKKQNSKELGDLRKSKTDQANAQKAQASQQSGTTTGGANVLSLRKGKRTGGQRKANAAEIRAQKDISEMDLEATPGVRVDFPDTNNLMNFNVWVKPNDGLWKGAEFEFKVQVPNTYPYDPPLVECNTLVYHPNIDWKGRVCLNILRADWKPVLTLGSVIFGLMTLFLEPNPDDPLNKEAAELMVQKRAEFEKNVKQSLRGGNLFGRQFPVLIKN